MASWFSDTFAWLVGVGKFFRATEKQPPPQKAKLVELAAEKKRRTRKPKGAA